MIEFPFVIHNNKKSKNGLYSFYSNKKPELFQQATTPPPVTITPAPTPLTNSIASPAVSAPVPNPVPSSSVSQAAPPSKNALLTADTTDFISKISDRVDDKEDIENDQENDSISESEKFNIETESNSNNVDKYRFFMKKKESEIPTLPKYKLKKVQDESGRVQYKLVEEETNSKEMYNDESDVSAIPGEINDKQEPPHKYRLEKYQDASGEFKFKLQKVVEPIIETVTTQSQTAPMTVPIPQEQQEQQNNVNVVQNKKRYKLDKIVSDDGIVKYTLKEYENEIQEEILPAPTPIPSPPPSSYQDLEDEMEESISVEKFQQLQSFQNMIYSNKVEIHNFPSGKQSSFLIGDDKFFGHKSFCAQKVIENSYYLNNSNFLDSINIKIISQNLNQKTELSLGLYILEVNSTVFTKIQQISLGDFEKNMGKVSTKTLEFKTPKKGCFLVSILDVKTLEDKKLEGSLLVDYNIYITKQRMNKDREIILCKMNETLSIH